MTARSSPGLAVASTVIVVSPRPDEGLRLSHAASADAVHSHIWWVRTSMPARPPLGASVSDGAEIVYRHGAPCWATSTCCSAIAIVALRWIGSAFALTRYAMVPSPCPSLPERISTHDAEAVDDQPHSRATATFSSPVPPDELKLFAELVMDSWHRVAVGPVVLVTALLPQAVANARPAANRRARTRLFTRELNTSHAPAQ